MLLNSKSNECILDLGCGTGDLTKQISETANEVLGIDNSENMIEKAKQKYKLVEFRMGDITSFLLNRQFDAIFSNAVLHWVVDAEKAIKNIAKHLKVGGRFVAEFGGKGCNYKIISAMENSLKGKKYPTISEVLYFPSISEYTSLLERNGFEVNYAVLFDRPTELKGGIDGMTNFIEMFFNWIFTDISVEDKNAAMKKTCEKLKKTSFKNHTWIADYRRIQVMAMKIQ